MSILLILLGIALAVILALAVIGIIIWLVWFIEDLDVEFPNPIDAIGDHAERTADIVNEFLERKRGK